MVYKTKVFYFAGRDGAPSSTNRRYDEFLSKMTIDGWTEYERSVSHHPLTDGSNTGIVTAVLLTFVNYDNLEQELETTEEA